MSTRSLALLVCGTVAATALTACGGSGGSTGTSSAASASGSSSGSSSASSTEKITLTVGTFNEFGYEPLIAEYMKLHPNITVQQKKAATTNEARDNMNTRLAAGSGLSDIEAVEVDWLPELMQYPDKFVDLTSDSTKDRWLDWKAKQATTGDGKLIGYGTDIGPMGICYRSDLFAKAGLPTDRAAVAKALGTTWEDYFALGKKFTAATKIKWVASAGEIYQAMVQQLPNAYENNDGTVIATENPEVKKLYDTAVRVSKDGLSAGLSQWTDDWTGSFQRNGFATMPCPSWMLGVIKGNAAGVKGWDIANTFPGGGGNWGGSFLTVPAQGKHAEEAKALADWLTAPEQQIKAFAAKSTFPSQVKALESPELAASKDTFFNNAPTGQIFAERAKAVTVNPFKGPKYSGINDAMQAALTRVDIDKTDSPESSWEKFVDAVKNLG